MHRILTKIENIDTNQWEKLLSTSTTASFFQSKECYLFYQTLPFVEPFIFAIEEDSTLKGVIVGYITKDKNSTVNYFTRRAIIYAGPMFANDISNELIGELLKACNSSLNRKAIYIETRNFNDYSIWKNIFADNGFRYCPHYNFKINTTTKEFFLNNLDKNKIRDIKNSFKEGAEIVIPTTESEVKEFYEILKKLYKTKVKTPLFPLEFFLKLYHSTFAKYFLIKYDNSIIGGTVCCGFADKVLYEWFTCGEDKIYKNIHPSSLATYAGIEYASSNNYQYFDMMGAGAPNDGGYGVRNFKAKFGGNLVEEGRFLSVKNKMLYFIGKVGVSMIKKATS